MRELKVNVECELGEQCLNELYEYRAFGAGNVRPLSKRL